VPGCPIRSFAHVFLTGQAPWFICPIRIDGLYSRSGSNGAVDRSGNYTSQQCQKFKPQPAGCNAVDCSASRLRYRLTERRERHTELMKLRVFMHRISSLSLLLLLLPVASVHGQTEKEQVSAITSALRAGEFDKALELLQPALRNAPNNPQLWMFSGLAYSGKRDSKSAFTSYQHALEVSPDYLPALGIYLLSTRTRGFARLFACPGRISAN